MKAYTYQGIKLDPARIHHWRWQEGPGQIIDVETIEPCDRCGGEGCRYCLNTGYIEFGDAVVIDDDYYDELIEEAHTNNLLRARYGTDRPRTISDWWLVV